MIINSITEVKGIGPAVAQKLQRLGIETIFDLLNHVPTRYEDYSKISKVDSLMPGAATIRAEVVEVQQRYIRRGMHVTTATLRDDSGQVRAVWFNQRYVADSLKKADEWYFSGEYGLQAQRYQLMNPRFEQPGNFQKQTSRILPIYKETKGLTSTQLRRYMFEVRDQLRQFTDIIPDNLLPLSSDVAYDWLHFPDSMEQVEKARDYLAMQELQVLLLSSYLARQELEQYKAPKIDLDIALAQKFRDSLSFTMTDAQRRESWQIIQDLATEIPMNRLLEGDVGSGKTLVAAFSALQVASAGYQTVILAPTAVLANQHKKSLTKTLLPFGLTVGLLTRASKKNFHEQSEAFTADVIVGTHAIIQPDINFDRVGLVVIDEQHRFGVKQRAVLQRKNNQLPHLLSMTATPIPRSLALTVYGELEISLLDEMPVGRKVIETKIMPQAARPEMMKLLEGELENGRQAYIVCPLVEPSEFVTGPDVTTLSKKLQKTKLGKKYKIAMLHGKMKDDEKDKIMQQFQNEEIDVLVSTTVIEVGVDVANATVMIIEGAERFGLAQLHQLRGRVGRSEHKSYCYIVPSNDKFIGKRLKAMATTSDGFALAELDLQLRGAGALYGTQQSGQINLNFASLTDVKQIARAKQIFAKFIKQYNIDDYPELKQAAINARSIVQLN
jgi:ATP-dependent DNA helicase RecG